MSRELEAHLPSCTLFLVVWVYVCCIFFFRRGSHFTAQAGLEIEMFVHPPSTSWHSRCEPSSLVLLALLTVVFTRADEKITRLS